MSCAKFVIALSIICSALPARAQTCVDGGACNPSSVNRILYVDGSTYTLSSAIAAANASGNTTVIVPSAQTISGGLTLTGAGVNLMCRNNATLTAGSGGFWMLTVSGAGDAVENCSFSPGNNSGAFALLVSGAVNPKVVGNTISGFQAGNALIYIVGTSDPIIRNNRLTVGSGGPDCVFAEMNTTDADVEGNFLDESLGGSGAHAIGFHSTNPGESVSGSKIVNNTILAGLNFCVEVGAFGGLTPAHVVIGENTCKLTKNGGSGGYSMNVAGSSITGNVFDANGFTATIAAYEIVLSENTAVTGNSANIGQAWASTQTGAVSINASNGISFTGNSINGWGGGNALSGSGWGIAVGTGGNPSVSLSNNVISGNVLVFPSSQGSGGIFQQCQTSGSICSNNVYSGNVLVGNYATNSLGFRLEDDNGTMQNTLISGNSMIGLNYGVDIWNSNVDYTHIYYNLFSIIPASNDIIDSGTGTVHAP